MKPRLTYANVVSTLALLFAIGTGTTLAVGDSLISSADIRNGAIRSTDIHRYAVKATDIGKGAVTSTDLRNEGVKTADLGTGAVQTSDIGEGQVQPQDLTLPAPATFTTSPTSGSVGAEFAPLVTVGTYQKTSGESVLQVDWSGVAAPGEGTNCIFQLRVNRQSPSKGGGEVFANTGPVNVSTTGLFPDLGSGPVTIEVWAKYSFQGGPPPSCQIDTTNPGLTSAFVVTENVT